MGMIKSKLLHIAWLISLVATFVSLYYSEVLLWRPCNLCWYQRIFMYPLVVLLLVAILREDKNVVYYGLPLAIIGALLAFYHYLLQMSVLPEITTVCGTSVSCSVKYVSWYGFVNIPFMSLLAFAAIGVCLVWYNRDRVKGEA